MTLASVSFLVRCVHVVAVAVALGGSTMVAVAATHPEVPRDGGVFGLLVSYERLFWIALGVIAMTGVGNLGAFGAGLPGADTLWGRRLTLKLSLVVGLVVLSLVRTAFVARIRNAGTLPSETGWRIVRGFYELTAATMGAILVVALTLAHA